MSNNNENNEKLDSYNEGKGKKLQPENNSNTNNNKFEISDDNKITAMRIGGVASFIVSLVMFLLSAIFNPFIAIGGAILFVASIGCAFGSFYVDQKQSQEERSIYNHNLNNDINKSMYDESEEEEYSCGSNTINNSTTFNLNSQNQSKSIAD